MEDRQTERPTVREIQNEPKSGEKVQHVCLQTTIKQEDQYQFHLCMFSTPVSLESN